MSQHGGEVAPSSQLPPSIICSLRPQVPCTLVVHYLTCLVMSSLSFLAFLLQRWLYSLLSWFAMTSYIYFFFFCYLSSANYILTDPHRAVISHKYFFVFGEIGRLHQLQLSQYGSDLDFIVIVSLLLLFVFIFAFFLLMSVTLDLLIFNQI